MRDPDYDIREQPEGMPGTFMPPPTQEHVAAMKGNDMQDPMLQFFSWDHLPERLREISKPFGMLATSIVNTLPVNPERTAALRKLLEAKDCAVRAVLYREA